MIEITDKIAERSYKHKKTISISFIENVITCNHYILSGIMSDLWQLIVNKQTYNDIIEFAMKNNIDRNIVNDFLSELKTKGIINTDIQLPQSKSNYLFGINEKSANYKLFSDRKEELFIYNKFLEYLDLNLNYTCNLGCKHCCNYKDLNEYEMDFNSAKKIIDEAYELGLFTVDLTGGEGTLNNDFLKIAEYIREKKLRLCILTNGQKLYDNNTFFEKLISLYPSVVQLSLYSMQPAIHDNLTGVKGSHYKTLSVIKKLRERNINTKIVCVQTSYNYNSFSEVKKFAETVNAGFSTYCRFQFNPKNKNLNAKLSKKEIVDFYVKTIDLNNPRKNIIKCTGGLNRISIMPNLEVNPCIYCNFNGGNLKSMSLKEIRNKIIKEFQEKVTKENLKECFNYDYCEYCSYCPIYTCNTKDGFLKKSEILCEDAQAYKEALFIKRKNFSSRF